MPRRLGRTPGSTPSSACKCAHRQGPPEWRPQAADPIHYHPAMRRVLLELRATSEGMRAIGYWAAHLLDQAEHDPSLARQRALQLAQLLTPIIKAFFTEQGFRQASNALQVFGGYGYVAEFAIEQTLRDSRIAMIYEGSNEIQANDLLLRKVLGDEGRAFGLLLAQLREEAGQGAEMPQCAGFAGQLASLCGALHVLVGEVRERSLEDIEYPYRAAGNFLQLCGVTLLALAWARAARVSRHCLKTIHCVPLSWKPPGFFSSTCCPRPSSTWLRCVGREQSWRLFEAGLSRIEARVAGLSPQYALTSRVVFYHPLPDFKRVIDVNPGFVITHLSSVCLGRGGSRWMPPAKSWVYRSFNSA